MSGRWIGVILMDTQKDTCSKDFKLQGSNMYHSRFNELCIFILN